MWIPCPQAGNHKSPLFMSEFCTQNFPQRREYGNGVIKGNLTIEILNTSQPNDQGQSQQP